MCDYGIANQSKVRVGVLIADQVVFKPSTHTFFFFLRYSKVSTKENYSQNNKSSQCVCASTLSFSIYERILIQDQTDWLLLCELLQSSHELFEHLFQILKFVSNSQIPQILNFKVGMVAMLMHWASPPDVLHKPNGETLVFVKGAYYLHAPSQSRWGIAATTSPSGLGRRELHR